LDHQNRAGALILDGFVPILALAAALPIVRGTSLLLKTITAFTVAHTITLGLATFGVVRVAALPVEAVISLSIVFLASEIVTQQRGIAMLTFRAPWSVVFSFGFCTDLASREPSGELESRIPTYHWPFFFSTVASRQDNSARWHLPGVHSVTANSGNCLAHEPEGHPTLRHCFPCVILISATMRVDVSLMVPLQT